VKYLYFPKQYDSKESSLQETKLKLHLKVLSLLSRYSALSFSDIESYTKISEEWTKANIDLLIEQGLVRKERSINLVDTYAVTDRGIKVLKFFRIPYSF